MQDEQSKTSQSRRRWLKGIAAIPVTVVTTTGALTGCESKVAGSKSEHAYTPTFFNKDEWRFVVAACDRLIPHDEHGPGAVESGVPEFLDRHMQTPYASGDIWYLQGPFIEARPEFGYQGRLALRDIIRVGLQAVDRHCREELNGKVFADLDANNQEEVLKQIESGRLKLEEISAKTFFSSLLNEVRNGYFADPKYGGNKDMGAWKMIGYPGMRADYMDWVEVRNKPYPIGPVDLRGRRA